MMQTDLDDVKQLGKDINGPMTYIELNPHATQLYKLIDRFMEETYQAKDAKPKTWLA